MLKALTRFLAKEIWPRKKRIVLSLDIFISAGLAFVFSRQDLLSWLALHQFNDVFSNVSAFASLAFGFCITTATVCLSLAHGRLGKELVREDSSNPNALGDLVFVYLWGAISSLSLVAISVFGVFVSENGEVWPALFPWHGWLVGTYAFLVVYTLMRLIIAVITFSSFVRVFIVIARK